MAQKIERVRASFSNLLIVISTLSSLLISLSISFAPHEEQVVLLQVLSAIVLPLIITLILWVIGTLFESLCLEIAGMYGIVYNTAFAVFYFFRVISSTFWVFSDQVILSYYFVIPVQIKWLTLIPCLLTLFLTEPVIKYLEIDFTKYFKLSKIRICYYRASFVLVLFLALFLQPALWGGLIA